MSQDGICLDIKKFQHTLKDIEKRPDVYTLPSNEMEKVMAHDRERISRITEERERCKTELVTAGIVSHIRHLQHRIFYFDSILEILEHYQRNFKHIIQKRKCDPILEKLGGLLPWRPDVLSFKMTIPKQLFHTVDTTLFPRPEAFTQWHQAYNTWVTNIPGAQKLLADQQSLNFWSSFETDLYNGKPTNGRIIQISNADEEPDELIVWTDTFHWMKNGILPNVIIDDLYSRGLTEDEIQTLFPRHRLPARRLD